MGRIEKTRTAHKKTGLPCKNVILKKSLKIANFNLLWLYYKNKNARQKALLNKKRTIPTSIYFLVIRE